MKQHAALIAFCFFISLAAGCHTEKAQVLQPKAIKVKPVESISTEAGQRYSASIAPYTQVDLAFKSGGYVAALSQIRGADGRMRSLQLGDVVLKGTVLGRVRPSDYQAKVDQAKSQLTEARSSLEASQARLKQAKSEVEVSKSQIAEAQAGHEKARLDWERAEVLFPSGSMTKIDYDATRQEIATALAKLDQAKSQYAVSQSRVESAQSEIEAGRARIKSAEAATTQATIPLEDTILRAPFSGVLLQRKVDVGSLVSASSVCFTLADITSVKVTFGVADMIVSQLKLGDSLAIKTQAFPGEEFRGHITAIAPSADPSSRVFSVEVTVPNPENRLRSGMIASLEVFGPSNGREAAAVPLTAIVRSKTAADSYAVFVVEAQGSKQVARQRNVSLGETVGNSVLITSGLKVGEQVIVSGAPLLQDGEAVQVIP